MRRCWADLFSGNAEVRQFWPHVLVQKNVVCARSDMLVRLSGPKECAWIEKYTLHRHI